MTTHETGNHNFLLTEEHLVLLHHMYVGWQDMESGAPEIDPKRPYGNNDVAEDVCRILGRPTVEANHETTYLTSDLDAAGKLHRETATALQIVLCTQSFRPGRYQQQNRYDGRSWVYLGE